MKDKQFQSGALAPGLPIISPVLHVLAMPGLVFLRSSFGYSFLSPKSIFLACVWAHLLFSVYAWYEPGMWSRWRMVVLAGLAAGGLYVLHLLKAFGREVKRSGKHDYHSGTSHLMRLSSLFRPGIREKLEPVVHLWLEPALVLAVAVFCGAAGMGKLPSWLALLACALWAKETINYWYRLRYQKKRRVQ